MAEPALLQRQREWNGGVPGYLLRHIMIVGTAPCADDLFEILHT
jgi:hypothetical protein